MVKYKNKVYLAVLLTVLAAIPRLYFALTVSYISYNEEGIPRLRQAREWLLSNEAIPGGLIWLPFYHIIVLALTPFGLDAALSGRIMITTLGILSIPLFYLMVYKVFNPSVAFWAAVLLAINPFHIYASTTFLSEAPFIFFVIVAFYCLVRHIQSGAITPLLLSALALNCANLIRFEGWLITGLLILYLLIKSKNIKRIVLYSLVSCITVLLYMALSYHDYQEPLHGITMSNMDNQLHYRFRQNILKYFIDNLYWSPVIPYWTFALCAVGMVYSVYKKQQRSYLFIWSVLLAIPAYKVLTLTLSPYWRYFSCSVFMLLPFAAVCLSKAADVNRFLFSMGLVVVLLAFYNPVLTQYESAVMATATTPAYKQACKAIMQQRKDKDYVIYEDATGSNYSSWQEQVKMKGPYLYVPPDVKGFPYEPFSDTVLTRLLKDNRYKFIFFEKQLRVDSILRYVKMNDKQLFSAISLDTLYNSTEYGVIQINRIAQNRLQQYGTTKNK